MSQGSMAIEETEVDKLIAETLQVYGYDFNGYARTSFVRRVNRYLSVYNLNSIEALKEKLFGDKFVFENFVQEITVNRTEMFRDPDFYRALQNTVFPALSTYPYIKIWDAGCSTGEELYSLAILLDEVGLLQRTRIYATDINQHVLKKAKEGIYPASNIQQYTSGYYNSGGKKEFSDYYTSNYGSIKFKTYLTKNVVFYPHNLAMDQAFNEFHLVVCRNVLIYFNRTLQERVYTIFDSSLVSLGFLGLGMRESISFSSITQKFEIIDKTNKIYRKIC